MPTNVPAGIDRRAIERGLAELRKWRQHAIRAYAQTDSDPYATRNRQLADDLEWIVWRTEQLLHPAGGAQ